MGSFRIFDLSGSYKSLIDRPASDRADDSFDRWPREWNNLNRISNRRGIAVLHIFTTATNRNLGTFRVKTLSEPFPTHDFFCVKVTFRSEHIWAALEVFILKELGEHEYFQKRRLRIAVVMGILKRRKDIQKGL